MPIPVAKKVSTEMKQNQTQADGESVAVKSEPTDVQKDDGNGKPSVGLKTAAVDTPAEPMPSENHEHAYEDPPSSPDVDDEESPDDYFGPLDKLTIFDFLQNLELPQKLESWHQTLAAQKDKMKRQQERLKATSLNAKDKVLLEFRKRSHEEHLEKYLKRMRDSIENFGARWTAKNNVTAREKVAFVAGVLDLFGSTLLIGTHPTLFYYWYTIQMLYFLPVRFITYRKIGYHYFMADLCYAVNILLLLSIWVFPQSKRLYVSTFCLAFGNNAIAIALWRNSLVFHSLDKVTSVCIHLLPPVTLHCLSHLTPLEVLRIRFPAIYDIKTSPPSSPQHYSLTAMSLWASATYMVWQLSYHFLITVRRRDKIAAGRPTSYTWLRKSQARNPVGRFVLSLPNSLQEPAFMLIQYFYALLTMIPCPFWFWYKHASTAFLFIVFSWSVYNGATFYIDVFGKRFEKELKQLKADASMRWNSHSDVAEADRSDTHEKEPNGKNAPNGSLSQGDTSARSSQKSQPSGPENVNPSSSPRDGPNLRNRKS